MNWPILCVLVLNAALVTPASAQQFVYPAKGQTPQQQKTDEAACYTWAVQQTGFDPAKPASAAVAAASAPAKPPATGAKAGLRGAAGGAVVGEIVTGDATAGAAAGAVAAVGQSRRQSAAAAQAAQKQQQAAQQQQQAAAQQQQASFARARSACLEGKGYTVK